MVHGSKVFSLASDTGSLDPPRGYNPEWERSGKKDLQVSPLGSIPGVAPAFLDPAVAVWTVARSEAASYHRCRHLAWNRAGNQGRWMHIRFREAGLTNWYPGWSRQACQANQSIDPFREALMEQPRNQERQPLSRRTMDLT